MRTRRSWRNQESLWKLLGGPRIEMSPPKPRQLSPEEQAKDAQRSADWWAENRAAVLADVARMRKKAARALLPEPRI